MSIVVETANINSPEEIAQAMYRIARAFSFDAIELINLDLFQLYDRIKRISYVVEDGFFQSLSRPYYSLHGIAPYVACANKSIIIGAYCELVGIRYAYEIAAIDKYTPFHHVYPVILLNNPLRFDATYPDNVIGDSVKYAKTKRI